MYCKTSRGLVTQLVECCSYKAEVVGSNPTGTSVFCCYFFMDVNDVVISNSFSQEPLMMMNSSSHTELFKNATPSWQNVLMYMAFLTLPFTSIVIALYITSFTNLFWYQLLLSWTIPSLLVYALLYPIRQLYRPLLMSHITEYQHVSSFGRIFMKQLLQESNSPYLVWHVICLIIGIFETTVTSVTNNDNPDSVVPVPSLFFTVCSFSTVYYSLIGLLIMLVIYYIVNPKYDRVTNVKQSMLNDICNQDLGDRTISATAIPHEYIIPLCNPMMIIFIGLLLIVIFMEWDLFTRSHVSDGYVVGTYVTFLFLSSLIWFLNTSQYYGYKMMHSSIGYLHYILTLLMNWMLCTLFTLTYYTYMASTKDIQLTSDGNDSSSNTVFAFYLLFLLLSQVLYHATDSSIRLMCTPYLRRHYLFPHLLCYYVCQFAIFGFTPVSWQLILLNIINVVHQILRATNAYGYLVTKCLSCCGGRSEVEDKDSTFDASPSRNSKIFESISIIFSESQLHSQESLCVIQTLVSLTTLVYWFRFQNIHQSFTNRFQRDNEMLGISIVIQIAFKIGTWFLVSWILRKRLMDTMNSELMISYCASRRNVLNHTEPPSSFLCLLSDYIQQRVQAPINSYLYSFVMNQYDSDHGNLLSNVLDCDPEHTVKTLLSTKSLTHVLKQHFIYFIAMSCLVYCFLLVNQLSCPYRYVLRDLSMYSTSNTTSNCILYATH
jgi:hypothetical protein